MAVSSHNRTFTCTCGAKESINLAGMGCYNVGEARDKMPGWGHVFTQECDDIWLCPKCNAPARELAKELLEIIKNEYLYFGSLIR